MSILLHTNKFINDTASASINTHSVSSGNADEWVFGEVGLHWDYAYISCIGSDPIRVTFDDFGENRISAGEGFIVPGNSAIEINIQYSWSIHVVRHSGSGTPTYSILCSLDNRLRG